jgi:hypothetical protein
MGKPRLYRGKRPLKIPVATVLTFVKLLDDEHVLDEFVLKTRKLRLNLGPVTTFLNQKRVPTEKLPQGASPMPTAVAAARTVHTRFAEEFTPQHGHVRVSLTAPVVNAAKTFLAEKGIDQRSSFGASVVGTDPSQCATPNQCPHIPGDD